MAWGPHVSEPGEVKPLVSWVKLAGVDPCVVAGDTRDGGECRKSSSGDQISGRDALRDEETRPRPVVLTAAALVA